MNALAKRICAGITAATLVLANVPATMLPSVAWATPASDIQNLLTSASNNGTVELDASKGISGEIVFNRPSNETVTLDLKGFNLLHESTSSSDEQLNFIDVKSGHLIIKSSTATQGRITSAEAKDYYLINVEDGAELTLENVLLNTDVDESSVDSNNHGVNSETKKPLSNFRSLVRLGEGAKLTVNDHTSLISKATHSALIRSEGADSIEINGEHTILRVPADAINPMAFCIFLYAKTSSTDIDTKLTINNGTIEQLVPMPSTEDSTTRDQNYFAISGNGTVDGSTIVINDGKIKSAANAAIFHPQNAKGNGTGTGGTITVKGGTIEGREGIQMGGGTLTVEGGTIISNGTADSLTETLPRMYSGDHDGEVDDGAAISVVSRSAYGPVSVNLKAGTLISHGTTPPLVAYGFDNSTRTRITDKFPTKVTLNVSEGVTGSYSPSSGVVNLDTEKLVQGLSVWAPEDFASGSVLGISTTGAEKRFYFIETTDSDVSTNSPAKRVAGDFFASAKLAASPSSTIVGFSDEAKAFVQQYKPNEFTVYDTSNEGMSLTATGGSSDGWIGKRIRYAYSYFADASTATEVFADGSYTSSGNSVTRDTSNEASGDKSRVVGIDSIIVHEKDDGTNATEVEIGASGTLDLEALVGMFLYNVNTGTVSWSAKGTKSGSFMLSETETAANNAKVTLAAQGIDDTVIVTAKSKDNTSVYGTITVKIGEGSTTDPSDDSGGGSGGGTDEPSTDGKKSLSSANVTIKTEANGPVTSTTYTYDKIAKKPKVTSATIEVAGEVKTLYESTDYTVSYENNTNAGTAYVVLTANPASTTYSGSCRVPFTINPRSIEDMSISVASGPYTYNGKYQVPAPTIDMGDGNTIIASSASEFDVQYTGNRDAGTATVVIKGVEGGNYTGTTKETTFTIDRKSITDSTIIIDKSPTQDYTGSAIQLDPTIRDSETTISKLTKDTDYTLTWANNTNPGQATITVTGKGNYTGTRSDVTFTITNDISGRALVTLTPSTYQYNGTERKPAVSVRFGGKELTAGTDYDVSYSNNTDGPTGTVTIIAKGAYAGVATAEFTITGGPNGDASGGSGSGGSGSGGSGGSGTTTGPGPAKDDVVPTAKSGDTARATTTTSENGVKTTMLTKVSDGTAATGWQTVGGYTYYGDAAGEACVGKQTIDGNTYVFTDAGRMLTGAQTDPNTGGKIFLSTGSGDASTGNDRPLGAVITNSWVSDGVNRYYADENGHIATGFITDAAGNSYYLNTAADSGETGAAKAGGWFTVGTDNWYYADAEGKLATGWTWLSSKWYYFEDRAVSTHARMVTGWRYSYNGWYHFHIESDGNRGVMDTGWFTDPDDGERYLLGPRGLLVTGGYYDVATGNWYYMQPHNTPNPLTLIGTEALFAAAESTEEFYGIGAVTTGWLTASWGTYHFSDAADTYGIMDRGWRKIDGNWYFFEYSGLMKTGWYWENGKWYYFETTRDDSFGALHFGWHQEPYNNEWYYFGANGAMYANEYTPEGYWAQANGIIQL